MNLSSAGLPTVESHAKAKEIYEGIVPYRSGGDKGKRPLGNRRYNYCQIEHYAETDAVALQMFGSDVVTWFPNGEVHVSLCKYDTIGTRQFIWATTPYDIKHERGETYLQVAGGWYAFADSETPLIVKNNVVVNPTQTYTYKPRRDVMKSLQKRYGGFREYVKTMGLITNAITDKDVEDVAHLMPRETVTHMNNLKRITRLVLPVARNRYYHGTIKPRENLAAFLQDVEKAQEAEDLEAYYAMFVRLGVSSLYYHSYQHAYVAAWADKDSPIGKVMLAYFDEILKHMYREKVFTRVEVPIGTKVSNVNRKYFA